MTTDPTNKDDVLAGLAEAAKQNPFKPMRDANSVEELTETTLRLASFLNLLDDGVRAIFEAFPAGPERTLAIRRWQEATFWLTESVAGTHS